MQIFFAKERFKKSVLVFHRKHFGATDLLIKLGGTEAILESKLLGSTVGCVDCKLKFPMRRKTKNMLREMDHSSLPLDAQCRAAEEELGQLVRVDRLLLVQSPSNCRSSDPTYKFARAAQVHRL